jgi:hypothetical protein
MKSKRNLSSFGDVLVNFLFSFALSKACGVWEGKKVSNSILAKSLTFSHIRKPSRSDRQMLGNFVESFIARAWVEGIVSTEDCVEVLSSHLLQEDTESHARAFGRLLDFIVERCQYDKIADPNPGHR